MLQMLKNDVKTPKNAWHFGKTVPLLGSDSPTADAYYAPLNLSQQRNLHLHLAKMQKVVTY